MINMNWAQNISIIIGLLFEFYSAWILIKHVFYYSDKELEYAEATKSFLASKKSKKELMKETKKGKKAMTALIIGITFQLIALFIPY